MNIKLKIVKIIPMQAKIATFSIVSCDSVPTSLT